MNKKRRIDISKIQDFFDLILTERNASREEVHHFLWECLKFVFEFNNIDINQYEIQFHSLKSSQLKDFGAKMSQHQKYLNHFDVFLNHDKLFLKDLNQESISNLLSLMFMAMHEFGHIIQFIQHQDIMDDYDREHKIVYNNMCNFVILHDRKSQNLITKQYLKHEKAKLLISTLERDADHQAYIYSKIIFKSLLDQEDDKVMQAFLKSAITFFNKIRKDNYYEYRIADKQNKEALRILGSFGVKKEDLLTY